MGGVNADLRKSSRGPPWPRGKPHTFPSAVRYNPPRAHADIPFPRRIRLPHEAYANPESLFHIVIRARIGAAPFDGPVAETVWASLVAETKLARVELIAACLMPDHLHTVVSPGDMSVIRWVNAFKSLSTRRSWEAGWTGRLWQPGYFDRLLRDEAEYDGAVNYLRDNRVEAGLVSDYALWPRMLLPA